ncbi:furin-like protease 2 isoform X2 [Metopolophium dirhodum]|uniref:furin-like protease 2 isoform X2 n=1 Tax=Metopolophium dirhodum TaxID=44670 RepID=UPI00298FA1DF|nr:furin-like protease 2 isoform X2 [Metopolophium dirhodum]
MRPWFGLLCLSIVTLCVGQRQRPIYMNQFAVHIPKGSGQAEQIAAKHGFNNIGQIGSLEGFYLFEHKHVHKRSMDTSDVHHKKLTDEPDVHWVQQQHEKKRRKRDFPGPNLPATVFAGSTDFYQQQTSGGPLSQLTQGQPFRRLGNTVHNVFPDPLFKEQWYLNGGALDGFDMNMGPAWQKGYTGKNVVVSILDDGIQTNHPDLAHNYDPSASTDINDNDDDPMPRDNGDNKHGTRCAGEVAAIAFNQYCGIGVAYNASIGGVRMLDGTVNDAVEARALGLNINHIDIYSASWGPEDDGKTVDGPGPLARRAFIYGVTSGRHGKGSIFVWASGNGGRHTDSCNCDGYTNSIFTLSISSATQGGYKPWYLEECSSTLATTYSSGTPGHDKSVATVDMDAKLRPDHICTVEHTGTSASAPLAAGLCALTLEANPALTWRDMQYIVVLTSKSAPLEREGGWISNGVGRKVSHKFGYGLMDAGGMVSLAEQWTTVPPQHICKSQEIAEERQIDPTPGSTMTVTMEVGGCAGSLNEVRFAEHVQCKISLRFFPRGNLRIDLTSPLGTTSTLLFERPRDVVSSNFDDWPFLSVHYWGEKVDGTWTMTVHNGGNRHVNQPGILKKWQLIFYGTATNPIRLRSAHSQPSPPFAISQQQQQQLLLQPSKASTAGFPFAQLGGGNGNGQVSGTPSIYHSSIAEILSQAGFRNLPDVFAAAGSDIETSVTSLTSTRSNSQTTPAERPIDGQTILHDCDPECDAFGCYGKGPTQCVGCRNFKLDNTCVSRCPPRSFPNKGGVCWPCHESCETCAGAGQDSCLTCAPAHLRVTDLAVCLQQCPDGYFENTEEGTCVACGPNCGSCEGRPDHCTSCEHHLVLHDNQCYANCPVNTYETNDYRCGSCDSKCESCTGPNADQCITCKSGYFELKGTCHSKCPDFYYPHHKRHECLDCPMGCVACNLTECHSCDQGFTLNKKGRCLKTGSQQCQSGQFWTGTQCQSCHGSCETCSDFSNENCLSCRSPTMFQSPGSCVEQCSPGFYPDLRFGNYATCQPCPHPCIECVSRTNCTMCHSPLLLQTGQCRTTCAPGYYSDVGSCAKCYLSCMTCSGPRRDQCVSCPRGWQLAAGECHPECPQGFFMSDFGCQKCHHYCKTCKGEGPLQCTSCPPHFMLEDGLCSECSGSQYYDPPTQLCKPCHASCRACNGPGPFSCSACMFPLHLDRKNTQCVSCCGPRPHDDCCSCNSDTGECHNLTPAEKRRTSVDNELDNLAAVESVRRDPIVQPLSIKADATLFGYLALAMFASGLVVLSVVMVKRKQRKHSGYVKLLRPQGDMHLEDNDSSTALFAET